MVALNLRRGRPQDLVLRRHLVRLASLATVLAVVHFVDHVVRGDHVVDDGLDPDWNHSGWPFDTHTDKPYIFTISFFVVIGLLAGGLAFTVRRRAWAGYWLATSIVLVAFLLLVHFVGFSSGAAETPSVIVMSHDNHVSEVLALIDLFGLILVLAVLGAQSVRTRQQSGRW